MAYNKTKSVESAQKYLNLGKVSQAISEYQQILRNEPRDQVTLMTIGDLYVRQGETFQALEYFEQLAQIYLSDGFVTKAIAIYKKIAKLAPEESKALEKLAELYVQQGVMSEARPLYLQLAEVHLKAGRNPEAVTLLRKLLEAEPDNLRVQLRLGELYHKMGRGAEAAGTFLGAAQRLFDQKEYAQAENLAEKALKLDPKHTGALALRARALAALGKRADAAKLLEKMPDLDSRSEAVELQLDLYLQGGESEHAASLARKIVESNPKNYEPVYKVGVAMVDAGELDRALELLGLIREVMIEAGEQERLAQTLSKAAQQMPGRLELLEWLVDLYNRTNDSLRLPDAQSRLAEAAAAAGKLERAKQIYEQLLERDPENEAVRPRLNQVRAQLGLEPVPGSSPAPSVVAIQPEAPVVEAKPLPPVAQPALDEETRRFVAQALTDVDLFSSYGLTQKATDLLESVLQRAPRHPATLEKLLDLNLGAGNDRRTAELASILEQIYLETDEPGKAERFAELRRRFQRAAGVPEEVALPSLPDAPPEFPVPKGEAEPAPLVAAQPVVEEVEAVPIGEAAVHEVDLSEEWAALSQQIEQAMHASTATMAPAAAAPEVAPHAEAPALEAAIADVGAAATKSAEISEPAPALAELIPVVPALHAEQAGQELGQATGAVANSRPEYEVELGSEEVVEAVLPDQPAATLGGLSPDQFLNELATELGALAGKPAAREEPRGDTVPITGRPEPPPVPAEPREAAASPVRPAIGAPASPRESDASLREVFDEFRAELGELSSEEEDPETHYNLGIAYREMGLLDEAIGEFQKVAKGNDKGRAFRYAMQCCTLLGLSFMEKGQPQIAVLWYERALQTPGLDSESVLALRYDLGVAQELAGDEAAARKSFSQVYAMNIDYRDVAERIATLGKRR